MNLNKILITGNVTADPELRYTPNSKAVLSASLANNESYTDSQGQEQKVTTFVNLEVWGKPAENFSKLVKKGRNSLRRASFAWTNGLISKPTLAAPAFICWSRTGSSPNTKARRRAFPKLPLRMLKKVKGSTKRMPEIL
jgi:Single-strand binding protein family